MGVKVASFQLTQPQTLASIVSSPSLKRCSFRDGSLLSKPINKLDRSALFGTNLHRLGSRNLSKHRPNPIRRAHSADSSSFFDEEEFAKQLNELAMRFQTDNDEETTVSPAESEISVSDSAKARQAFDPQKLPEWPEINTISANIEWKANSVDLPLSLRMIKRKKQWREGIRVAGESACCSVTKAFSSMVFIIRELQCFTIQMREMILYQDLQGILSRVQTEMHASFVWLFQQVFSHTPTLMLYVMLLLANYSVHSMTAYATPVPIPPAMDTASTLEYRNTNKFDPSSVKTFSVSSNSGKTASVGGSGRGDGNFKPVSSSMDGGGRLGLDRVIVPDGVKEEESVSGQGMREEEVRLWNSIVDEAVKMQSESCDEALDHETLQRFVSPVSAKVEAEDYADYFKTELFYQMGLARDPNSPLLLANYAQFLYVVAHDYDRAEEYFKKAVKVEPPDAEALSKYASFLWQAKKDLWGAEEAYLDAISADPTNSYYAAGYAHFLWNTGGEETCYPIDPPDA